jgi:hypothetical protein
MSPAVFPDVLTDAASNELLHQMVRGAADEQEYIDL